MFRKRKSEVGTLRSAERATSELRALVDQEIKSRRLSEAAQEDEDPVSFHILKDRKFAIDGLEELESKGNSTGEEFLAFTNEVRSRHEAIRLISMFRTEHEETFVFAISGVLLRDSGKSVWATVRPSTWPKKYWPIEETQSSKDAIYQRATTLHQLAKTVADMLNRYKFEEYYTTKWPTYASSEEGASVLKLSEPFSDTLRAFAACSRAGESFEQILFRSSEAISRFDHAMKIPRYKDTSIVFGEEVSWALRLVDRWKNALQIFSNRVVGALNKGLTLNSTDNIYLEELDFFSEILKRRSSSRPQSESNIDFTYKSISPIVQEVVGPEKPVLFVGKQPDLKDLWDDEEGSFARVKKYRLPVARTFLVEVGNHTITWRINEIAVKHLIMPGHLLKVEAERRNSMRTIRELRFWSKMKHESIVPLLGLWLDFKRFPNEIASPCPVAPVIHGGTLDAYLRGRPTLPVSDRISIMFGIANALNYMHNHEYAEAVHGDLKPNNILIEDGKPYLCDFGCSHLMDDIGGLSTEVHSNFVWCAPERLRADILGVRQKRPTCASDMYSYGLVFLLTVHNIQPFKSCGETADDFRVRRSERDILPVEEARIPIEHRTLLKGCWETEPLLRITAHLALEEVKKLAR